jgi:hypothetical protein
MDREEEGKRGSRPVAGIVLAGFRPIRPLPFPPVAVCPVSAKSVRDVLVLVATVTPA